jgi:hypothetical protein
VTSSPLKGIKRGILCALKIFLNLCENYLHAGCRLYQRVARRLVLVLPMPALKASEQDDESSGLWAACSTSAAFLEKKEWKRA